VVALKRNRKSKKRAPTRGAPTGRDEIASSDKKEKGKRDAFDVTPLVFTIHEYKNSRYHISSE